ncbi:MAG: glycosyltransferase family 4 protein [Candidatus Dormibacteria bacterium]
MSSLRIILATFDDEPPLGGQGVVVAGMRRALVAGGVGVTTVAGRGAHAVAHPRLVGRAPLDFSLYLNRRPGLLTAGRPDLVHAHGGPGGVLLLRRPAVPLIYTAHHTYRQAYARTRPQRLLSLAERRSYALASMVLPVSTSTAEAVRALGIPASRIEVVPPGVEVPPVVEETRRDPGRLLFAGRLEPEKGVLDALEVMSALTRDNPAVSGAVVGTGSLEGAIKAVAAGLDRVQVLGSVDDATLADQYARASIVLMPSRYEGLGLVALEGMARGAAVAGYDVDGLRGVVAGSGGGLLVAPGDTAALREACASLLGDGDRRREMGARGRAHVLAHHSWAATVSRLVQIYQAVTGSMAVSPERPSVD